MRYYRGLYRRQSPRRETGCALPQDCAPANRRPASVVDQVVGRCKTEASKKAMPLDEHTARDLLASYRVKVLSMGTQLVPKVVPGKTVNFL